MVMGKTRAERQDDGRKEKRRIRDRMDELSEGS